jgi:hypothetical protein
MKSLLTLHLSVLTDVGMLCSIDTTLDAKYIKNRVEHQGDSFLTITLPSVSKDLERALDQGYVDNDLFVGFRRSKGSMIPAFLGGFLSVVFDSNNGVIRSDVGDHELAEHIRAIRQICGFQAKVERECSPERVSAAFDAYVGTDRGLRDLELPDLTDFSVMADLLFGDVFRKGELMLSREEFLPGHGPGAVADRLSVNSRWDPVKMAPTWHERLESAFPIGRYGFTSWRHFIAALDDGELKSDPGPEHPVKVVQVPKTMKTPRIIAEEPSAVMYIQQGLQRFFKQELEFSKFGSCVSYHSQVPNQVLARDGSLNGDLATLDLSEASDRVSHSVAMALFRFYPLLSEAMDAVRTRTADVPGHGIIPLNKYASMGSAVCFPVEAMVFMTIVMLAIKKNSSTGAFRRLLGSIPSGRLVRVYGDDIIIPVEHAQPVVDLLEAYGLKVNRSKSFWTGRFRESCGSDWYAGFDVTIVRQRSDILSRQDPREHFAESISATVSLRNLLYWRGLWGTVRLLDDHIEDVLLGHFPVVIPTSAVLGRESCIVYDSAVIHPTLFHPLVKGWVRKDQVPHDEVSGYGLYAKTLDPGRGLPYHDPKHLLRGGRPRVRRIKLGWFRPF